MSTVSIREAQKTLSDLIRAAERGEKIQITRSGKPVAEIVSTPIAVPVAVKKKRGMPDLKAFRDSIQMTGKPMSSVVIEMRQEERY